MGKDDIIRLCRAARKAAGITLKELRAKTDVSETRLSQFENGAFNWDIAHAYYLNVLNEAEKNTYTVIYQAVCKIGGN